MASSTTPTAALILLSTFPERPIGEANGTGPDARLSLIRVVDDGAMAI
jgi:hypothetical protein